MTTRTVVIASNNRHKIQEISLVLGSCWKVLSAQDVAPGVAWDESGTTFLENARIKARTLKDRTEHCVLADDSGLCVDALSGRPGVCSSSFGGTEGDHAANNRKLLQELKGVPKSDRIAHFRCLLLFLDESGKEWVSEGRCDGIIMEEPTGSDGFGYDPLFFVPSKNCVMAEMNEIEKNAVSHRGRALQGLLMLPPFQNHKS